MTWNIFAHKITGSISDNTDEIYYFSLKRNVEPISFGIHGGRIYELIISNEPSLDLHDPIYHYDRKLIKDNMDATIFDPINKLLAEYN